MPLFWKRILLVLQALLVRHFFGVMEKFVELSVEKIVLRTT